MAPKPRPISSGSKKPKKSLTLKQKYDIIQMSEKGLTNAEIGRQLELARQTVSTIVCGKEKIMKEIKNATPIKSKLIRKNTSLISEMEKLLVMWIENQTSHNIPLSTAIIKNKALILFQNLKTQKGDIATNEVFEASNGWFYRFKERSSLHNIQTKGESASADVESAKLFPVELAKIIEEGGYCKKRIFNVDETGLYWKKMPSLTFISVAEKSMPGFKSAKDRLTLLLGSNASGECRLKHMLIYHSQNPRALKNKIKSSLPVFYKWNKKAWMTADLFTEWYTDCFYPEVKAYCHENNLPFKILVLWDNAPSHPKNLLDLYPEIKIIFMPPNTTLLIQPMDQGVISNFKAYYLRRVFAMAIHYIDNDTNEESNKLKEFWKKFNILDAIKSIDESWKEVKTSALAGVWKKLLGPAAAASDNIFDDDEIEEFHGFEDTLQETTESVVNMARQLNLEVDPEDVAELLESHDAPLTDEDFFRV